MTARCVVCSTVRTGPVEPTLVEGIGMAKCMKCGTRTPHREVAAAPADTQPVARSTDPGTSWAAARSVTRIRQTQQWILDLLATPMTDEQIALALERDGHSVSPSGARTRRAELVDLGLVVDSGQRTLLKTGRRAIVWAAVKAKAA